MQYMFEVGSANADSNFNYISAEVALFYMYPIDPYNQIRFKFHMIGGGLPQPFTRTFYAGGPGALRGYDANDVNESNGVLITLEYQRNFYPMFMERKGKRKRIGVFTFIDYAEAETYIEGEKTFAEMFDDSHTIKRTSFGFGVDLLGFRFILAKPIDHNVNEWKIVFELGSFLDRKYNFPFWSKS